MKTKKKISFHFPSNGWLLFESFSGFNVNLQEICLGGREGMAFASFGWSPGTLEKPSESPDFFKSFGFCAYIADL